MWPGALLRAALCQVGLSREDGRQEAHSELEEARRAAADVEERARQQGTELRKLREDYAVLTGTHRTSPARSTYRPTD